jgi:nicotinamide-nucleotide amidase
MKKLNQLVTQVGTVLSRMNLTLTTAESCTGGGLSYAITELPGSSTWFECSFVTYSNFSKMEILNVQAETLDKYGAVSEEVASEMAKHALLKSKAGVAIAITGIAGPGGASLNKPLGTVWIAWISTNYFPLTTKLFNFKGNRYHIRIQAMESALENLLTLDFFPNSLL